MIDRIALRKSHSIALRALRRNRLQTVLTMSGMSIGVATVLTVVALGSGAQEAIRQQVRAAGMNVIVVSAGNYRMKQQWTSDGETEEQKAAEEAPVPPTHLQTAAWPGSFGLVLHRVRLPLRNRSIKDEQTDPENMAGLGASDLLSLDDAAAVAALPGVQSVSAGLTDNARVEAAGKSWFTRLDGESADLPKIRRAWVLAHGRFFSQAEVDRAEDVAVLGSIVSRQLFGGADPVGRTIDTRGRSYRVIGEIASGSWMVRASEGDQQFDAVYVPVTSAQRAFERTSLSRLTVSTESTGAVTQVSKAITTLLRQRHGLGQTLPNDFVVAGEAHQSLARGGMRTDVARAVVGNVGTLDKVTLDQLGKTLDRASRTMTALLLSIATVSLVVGGIGIMNIMLLSVTERTHEIGIRRAVGARSEDVMLQFLMEAVLLSGLGGLLGIVVGAIAAGLVGSTLGWSVHVSALSVAVSFTISAAIGIAFGYYPAREASRVTPMTSLRYE